MSNLEWSEREGKIAIIISESPDTYQFLEQMFNV